MITHFINWIKGFLSKKEEPVVLEKTPAEEVKEEPKPVRVNHCSGHTRFRVNCPQCVEAVRV
jgi:hypothetical protein